MTITVLLPAYNEEKDLPGLLERLDQALNSIGGYQVLVVDDGSQDTTAEIVRAAQKFMPVTLIQHPQNMGLGAAIRTGLKAAAMLNGTIVTLDADNSQDPLLIPDMVEKIEAGADVVIASRFRPGAQEVGVPPHRIMLSHLSSGVIRRLVRYPEARDYTCGFRAYRLETIRQLIDTYGDNFLRENGFSCMLEVLLNIKRIGGKVAEVPLVLRYDLKEGASKMRIIRTSWRYLVTITRAFLPLRSAAEPAWAAQLREKSLQHLLTPGDSQFQSNSH